MCPRSSRCWVACRPTSTLSTRTPDIPSTAVPTVTTGTRRSRSETHRLVGERDVQGQQPVDPLGQRPGVQTAGPATSGHADRIQQQVVALLGEHLLGALDHRGEEPAGDPRAR